MDTKVGTLILGISEWEKCMYQNQTKSQINQCEEKADQDEDEIKLSVYFLFFVIFTNN